MRAHEFITPPFIDMIPTCVEHSQSGFYFAEGGCFAFALALYDELVKDGLTPQLALMTSACHAMVKLGGAFYDYQGMNQPKNIRIVDRETFMRAAEDAGAMHDFRSDYKLATEIIKDARELVEPEQLDESTSSETWRGRILSAPISRSKPWLTDEQFADVLSDDEVNYEWHALTVPLAEIAHLVDLSLDPNPGAEDDYEAERFDGIRRWMKANGGIVSALKKHPPAFILDPDANYAPPYDSGLLCIDGRHRLAVAAQAGLTSVPVIMAVKPKQLDESMSPASALRP